MEPQTVIIIISSLILLLVLVFIILYFKTEKIKREKQEENIESLKDMLSELKTLSMNTASDITNRFNDLRKEVKISQDQANAKMNSGFEILEAENKEIKKETSNYVSKLQTTFKEYAEKVDILLTKYSNDSLDNQKEVSQLKQQIQQELQNILKEIKAPLDLD